MELSQEAKDYIVRFKDDLKKNKFNDIFYTEFEDLDKSIRQEVIDVFIKSNIDVFEYLDEIYGATFRYLTLPKMILAPNVEEIGNFAFKATNIEKFYAPKCEYIGTRAFENCRNLKSVNIQNVSQLGMFAFSNCSSLLELSLPEVGIDSCFGLAYCCVHLKKLYLPNCMDDDRQTIEDTIEYIFNYTLANPVYDLEELYIRSNGNSSINTNATEEIKTTFPNLKVIDVDTKEIIRDYTK